MRNTLIIGTRGSKLALIQTDIIAQALKKELPELLIETKIIATKGDMNSAPIPLDTIGKAWFTAEIEEALVRGEIDLAVHSLKDVPPEIVAGTIILPVLKRADPRDVLISKEGSTFDKLPHGAIVGTDSSRRRAQLLAMRPDLRVKSIRGNVDTRLRKLREHQKDAEKYDAIVIAAAGLERLGLLDVVTQFFPSDTFIPAPGQGTLAVQARSDDHELLELLERIQDPETLTAVDAERAFIDTVGGGCKSPIGACALVESGTLVLHTMMAADDGTEVIRDKESGAVADASEIGVRLAHRMIKVFNAHA